MTSYATAIPSHSDDGNARRRGVALVERVRAWSTNPSLPGQYRDELTRIVGGSTPEDWMNAVLYLIEQMEAA